ncbi:MAG: GNAT family N-acetyltransferase [Clostridia bacterium]
MKDLETENLRIRKFKIEDAEDIYKNLATDRRLEDCLGYNVHQSVEQTRKMISSYIYEYEADELVWALEEKQNNSVVGYINALEFSDFNKYCNIKFGIALKFIEKHYMEEALTRVLEYIFNEKDFNMVVSEFYDGNKQVNDFKTTILEKLGMKKEAVLRNRKINEKTGLEENQVIYSITKDEFLELNKIREHQCVLL